MIFQLDLNRRFSLIRRFSLPEQPLHFQTAMVYFQVSSKRRRRLPGGSSAHMCVPICIGNNSGFLNLLRLFKSACGVWYWNLDTMQFCHLLQTLSGAEKDVVWGHSKAELSLMNKHHNKQCSASAHRICSVRNAWLKWTTGDHNTTDVRKSEWHEGLLGLKQVKNAPQISFQSSFP